MHTHACTHSHTQAYCKPVVVSEPAFDVRGGFHPVIASLQLEQFVRNNCNMDQHRLWIITGPNMGGIHRELVDEVIVFDFQFFSP